MCSDAPPPPDFTPIADAMKDMGSRMEALGNKSLAFGQQRYEETMPFYQRMIASNIEGQNLAMKMARENAADRQGYRALEQQMLSEAMNQDRSQMQNLYAGRAAADVENATATARATAMRNLSRMGINPNAARFADLNNQVALQGAAMKAGAMTNARMGADQMYEQKRVNALNIGRNMPATQLSAISTGSGVGNSNAQLFGSQNAPMFQGLQSAMGGLQGNLGAQSGIANVMSQNYQNQLAYNDANNSGWGQLGQLAGAGLQMSMGGGFPFKFADGGEVTDHKGVRGKNKSKRGGAIRGPGTGTSDSVKAINEESGDPIRLSNGEYILPADTVRKVGKQALDQLVEETHKPVRKAAINRG